MKRNPEDAKGWLRRRGRPPEDALTEDAARSALRAFLDQQTDRTPPERVTVERCVDAFLADCEERGRSPNTLRTYRQIAAEVKARWQGWRVVDVDYDELEDYRDELAERGLAGSTLNQRRAVLSGIFRRARRDFRVNVDPMDGFERADVRDSGDLDVYSVEEVWALVRVAGVATPGVHINDVKVWMGHRQLATTMRYVHHVRATRPQRRSSATSPAPSRSSMRSSASPVTSTSDHLRTTPDDPIRPRNAAVRGHFGVLSAATSTACLRERDDFAGTF